MPASSSAASAACKKACKPPMPFGKSQSGARLRKPCAFLTGKERDTESANDYFGARYYWNGAARWLSVDPVAGDVSDPQLLNGYRYCRNDPVNLVDSDGRFEGPFVPDYQQYFTTFHWSLHNVAPPGPPPQAIPGSGWTPPGPPPRDSIIRDWVVRFLSSVAGVEHAQTEYVLGCGNAILAVLDATVNPGGPAGMYLDLAAFLSSNLDALKDGTLSMDEFSSAFYGLAIGTIGNGLTAAAATATTTGMAGFLAALASITTSGLELTALEASESESSAKTLSFTDIYGQQNHMAGFATFLAWGLQSTNFPRLAGKLVKECGVE